MNQTLTTGTTQTSAPASGKSTTSARRMLTCGIVAGPLFVTTATAQALTRDGYDLTRHPISMLSLGDYGWIQITNFIVTGLLAIGFAVGIRWVLYPGRAALWGPILVAAFGIGLIIGGVFVTDPAFGFPSGAPEGMPADRSWHSLVHDIAPALSVDGLVIACFVFARRFAGRRQRGWQVYSVLTALVVIGLTWLPTMDGISVRLAVAVTVLYAWTTALAVYLRRQVDG